MINNMSSVEQYLTDAKNKIKEEFANLYQHPFLVQYLESTAEENAKKIAFSTITVKRLDDLLKICAAKKEIINIFPVLKSNRNPFASKITIGRTTVQDIVIDDLGISKFHAYFETKDGIEFTISDRGSTNGSQLNGESLGVSVPKLVKDHDLISFAAIRYNFYFPLTAYEIFRQF